MAQLPKLNSSIGVTYYYILLIILYELIALLLIILYELIALLINIYFVLL